VVRCESPQGIEEDIMVSASLAFDEPTPFSPTTLRRLRRRLLAERVQQLKRAAALEDAVVPGAAMAVEWDLDAVLAARVRDTLREIEAALARMDAGTYGRCQGCGRRMPLARLEAVPYTRWCITCSRPLHPACARVASSGGRPEP
jgi:DnaK suppressor protein